MSQTPMWNVFNRHLLQTSFRLLCTHRVDVGDEVDGHDAALRGGRPRRMRPAHERQQRRQRARAGIVQLLDALRSRVRV